MLDHIYIYTTWFTFKKDINIKTLIYSSSEINIISSIYALKLGIQI